MSAGNQVTPERELRYREIARLPLRRDPAPANTGTSSIRQRVVIDILTGTSAGGINAIFLAKALANGESLDRLARMWETDADLDTLINDGRSRRGLPQLPPTVSPRSLLNSRRMYAKLREAFDQMDAETATRRPLVEELDLFVTTTDLEGLPVRLQLGDGGYLDNKPFGYAIDTIAARGGGDTARLERKLVFIDPDPERVLENPLGGADRPIVPNAVENALTALRLPAYETIREDLLRLSDRNRLVEKIQSVVRGVTGDFTRLDIVRRRRLAEVLNARTTFVTRDLDAIVALFGAPYGGYHRLKVSRLTDELAELVANHLRISLESDEYRQVRFLVQAWRDFVYDAMIFPISHGSEVGEKIAMVEPVRISPLGGGAAAGVGLTDARLLPAGIEQGHFGAFLDADWRANDILLGRLNAAEKLIKMMLAGLPNQDAAATASYIRRAQAAIIAEERERVGSRTKRWMDAIPNARTPESVLDHVARNGMTREALSRDRTMSWVSRCVKVAGKEGKNMEYLIVHFPRSRRVKIDDEFNGRTEEPIELESGTHVVSLGPPSNFTPLEIKIVLKKTNSISPREVRFNEKV